MTDEELWLWCSTLATKSSLMHWISGLCAFYRNSHINSLAPL